MLLLLLGGANDAPAQEPGGPHVELAEVIERGTTGPLLLLIPCAGCGAASWERFMEVNEGRFRMIAVTLPGYDGSPRPELPLWTDRTAFQDNAVARLSELVDARGASDVVLVGQSFGATIALRLAALRPDAVRAVVAVDAPVTSPLDREGQSPAERFAEARSTVDENWAIRLQEPSEYRSFNAARSLPDAESRLLHHGMFMASDRISMLHYWRENILQDFNPLLRRLEAPYLDVDAISAGASDPDSVAAAHVAAFDAAGRPARYRLVRFWETSHWVHVERPEELGTTIRDYLEGREVRDVGRRDPKVPGRAGRLGAPTSIRPASAARARSWYPAASPPRRRRGRGQPSVR